MNHALYDIWEEPLRTSYKGFPWKLQLHGYVANFATEEAAYLYLQSVKINRDEIPRPIKEAKNGKS